MQISARERHLSDATRIKAADVATGQMGIYNAKTQ